MRVSVLHIQRRVVGRMAAFFQLFDKSVISARSVPEASSYEPSFGTSRGSRTKSIRAYSANAFLSGHQRVIVSRDYNKAITHMVIRCQACKYLAACSLCSPVFARPRRSTISVLLCLNVFRIDCVLKSQYPFRFRSPFPSPFRSGQAMMDADCVLNWYCQFPPL